MSDYEVLELGPVEAWGDYVSESGTKGKRFVDRTIATQYIGVSANAVEPGEGSAAFHAHSLLEELYLFIDGTGEMALDDEIVPVGPGTTIRVGQGVQRAIHADPEGPGLHYLCIRSGGDVLKELPRDASRDPERTLPW